MRKDLLIGSAALALAFVGAGCAKPSTNDGLVGNVAQPAASPDGVASGEADVRSAADAAVDAILLEAAAENDAAAAIELDADDATSDKDAIQAFNQDGYDLQ